jgi:hypothetical protein
MNLTENFEVELFPLKINNILTQFIFYSSVIGIVGFIVCNIINIIICCRKKIRQEMVGFFNVTISLWNILTLSLGFIFYFPPSIHMQDVLLISDFSCATLNYSLRVCVQMSAWLHVFLSIDRYLCVAFHQKLKKFLTNKKKLSFIFLGLFAFFCIINVPNLFFRLSITNSSSFTPKVQCDSTPLINQIRNMIISIFRIVLPLVVQIIFSALLIYKLFKAKRVVMTNQSMQKEYRFARIILWLNLMFIITEAPFLLTTLYFSILKLIPTYPIDTNASDMIAIMTLVYYVSLTFSMYLFGSLFFVNLFTNKVFQREIFAMIERKQSQSLASTRNAY